MAATQRAMSQAANSHAAPVRVSGREGGHVLEMQRRRLVLATSELVMEDGLEGASVGLICRRAGMSRRTFYEIFEDREACFFAALNVAVERIGRNVVSAYERDGRWYERIRAALIQLLESFDVEPGLARLCLVETLKASPSVLKYRQEALDKLIAAVDEGRHEAKAGKGPVSLAAESTVGGVLSVVQARLLSSGLSAAAGPRAQDLDRSSLIDLLNPLMSMIVQPYLGSAAASRERDRPAPRRKKALIKATGNATGSDPFKDLPIRFTYRTARVMDAIASQPGASNREVADAAGVSDQGQASKLLRRLEDHELIVNRGEGQAKGEPNSWQLTTRGTAVQAAIAG